MYRMNSNTRMIETKVVGVAYENRQSVVALLTEWERVFLIREPDNSIDPNAIKVQRWDKQQIGYLSRDLACRLAPWMDRNRRFYKATVSRLIGGCYDDSSLGVYIKFYLPEE